MNGKVDNDVLVCSNCRKEYSKKNGYKIGQDCRPNEGGCEAGILTIPFGAGTQNKESTS